MFQVSFLNLNINKSIIMKARYLLLLLLLSLYTNAQTTSWDGTAWSNGMPNNSIDALITGSYDTSVNGEFTAKNLSISATGSIIISEGTVITVQTNLDNLGNFTIEDKGSLIMVDDVGTVFGNYIVKKDTPNNPAIYTYSFFSSPMLEEDSNINTIFNSADIIYQWDTTEDPTYWKFINHEDGMGNSNKLGLGKGYSVASTNMTGIITRTFTGEINTGDVTVPVYYSDSSASSGQFGYNIIGNPYPSAIDWFLFKADNASILTGTMYLWKQQASGGITYASNYVAVNALGTVPYNSANEFIGSAQGFVVRTNMNSSVLFKNSHRVTNNQQFFRNSTQSRLSTAGNSWLKITGSVNKSSILIGFNPNATSAFDDDYDGAFIGGADPLQFYSMMGPEKLLINAQPELIAPNNVSIPLGIKTSTAGNYTISIEEEFIDSEYLIKLEDTQTSTITDLRVSDYTFSITSTTEENSRFIVHYEYNSTLGIDDIIDENDFKVYFNNDDLNLNIKRGQPLPEYVSVYDLNGKLLLSQTYTPVINTNNLASGIYVIRLNFDGLGVVSRSVIKK